MKKVIELAEKICNQNWVIRNEFIEQMRKELTERRQLEQTPITEEWLKEHGWVQDDVFDNEWNLKMPQEDRHLCIVLYEKLGWCQIAHSPIRIYNLSQMLDALELCNIKID